jgi:hypothetical protein
VISQAPSRNLLSQFNMHQIGWIMPISQAPSPNPVVYHEIQEKSGLFRLVRRPAEIISLHGVMAFPKVRLFRRPAEVETGQGDVVTRLLFRWGHSCVRRAHAGRRRLGGGAGPIFDWQRGELRE